MGKHGHTAKGNIPLYTILISSILFGFLGTEADYFCLYTSQSAIKWSDLKQTTYFLSVLALDTGTPPFWVCAASTTSFPCVVTLVMLNKIGLMAQRWTQQAVWHPAVVSKPFFSLRYTTMCSGRQFVKSLTGTNSRTELRSVALHTIHHRSKMVLFSLAKLTYGWAYSNCFQLKLLFLFMLLPGGMPDEVSG